LYDEGGSVYATNKHLVFKNNRAPGNSGGGVVTSISYATYSDVEISGNQAGRGGGLYVMGGAPRFISSTIISNSASVYGGGIALIVNSCPPDGFCNLFIISDTLVAHNTAIEGGGMYSKDSKAYIYDTAIVENTANKGGGLIMETANALAPIYMMNSTVSGNQATDAGGDGGGGILVKWGALNLWHVTVADNSSAATTGDNGAGGISAMTDAQVVLTNTLVAQNTSALGRPDLSGNFISTGGNLVGATDGSSGITDGVKGDRAGSLAQPLNPLLAALGSGSAASAVHALLPGSPAIDLGISENCRHFDQRQVARPQGADCDAGAYESRRFTAGQWGGGGQSTATGSLFPNPLTLVISSPFGEPVTGGVLRFTAPASGASLSAPTLDVVIGASGAVSQAVRANSVAGNYTVAVSANGLDNVSDSFALTNTPGGTTQYLYLPVIQRR
jgi:hypothetical protein